MHENRRVFSQNGHRLIQKQTMTGVDNCGFAGDNLNPYGQAFYAQQFAPSGFANPYSNFGTKWENEVDRRNKNGDYLDMFMDEYSSMWLPIRDGMGELVTPSWTNDLGALDSLMPLSLQARTPQVLISSENQNFNPPVNTNSVKPQKNVQSRMLQQKSTLEINKLDQSMSDKDRENEFKLSQQISVKSLDSNRRHPAKKKGEKKQEKPQTHFPDPNFLITMKLIDPNFDLGAFIQNFSGRYKNGLRDNGDFIDSLEGLNPEIKFNLRAIFMDQNNELRKIENEIKLIRDEKEREDKQLVLDKVRSIEKELNRREKDKKFDQFKEELFSVI